MQKKTRVLLGAIAVLMMASAPAFAKSDVAEVKAMGQAAIYGGDKAHARDRALKDALRKAVEQAVGTLVSSETMTENFQLISDQILSKSSGYVKKYNIISEKEEDGVFIVRIKAKVSTGGLQGDLQGILSVLNSKNMPRVLVMVAEQNIGQGGANFWWGDKAFSTNLDAVENALIDTWVPKGIRFIDRQALQGKLSVGPAMSSAEPSNADIKQFAVSTGAEVVIIGKAIATDVGPIMGTQMHSIRANVSLRALNLDTGRILGTAIVTQAVGHIDPTTGGIQALKKVGQKAADELLKKLLVHWQSEVGGTTAIKLVLNNVKKSRYLRTISGFIKTHVRGASDVRQRSFRKKVAVLEVEMEGSAQDLAIELEEKKFKGFEIEIEEITANTVTATLSLKGKR